MIPCLPSVQPRVIIAKGFAFHMPGDAMPDNPFDFREAAPSQRIKTTKATAVPGKACGSCLLLLMIMGACGGGLAWVGRGQPTAADPSSGSRVEAEEEVRIRQGAEAFVRISEMKDKRERQKRIEEWMAKYPDLVENFLNHIASVAEPDEEEPVASGGQLGKNVRVQGYTRKDGTHVAPHTRSAPGRGESHR